MESWPPSDPAEKLLAMRCCFQQNFMDPGLSFKKKGDQHFSMLSRWWFQIFLCSHLPGEMIQVDEHMFQRGWFNHQLVGDLLPVNPKKDHKQQRRAGH